MVDHHPKKMCLVQLLEQHMDSDLRIEILNWLLRTEYLILEVILEVHCSQMWITPKGFMFKCSVRVHLVTCVWYKITELKYLCLIEFTVMTI